MPLRSRLNPRRLVGAKLALAAGLLLLAIVVVFHRPNGQLLRAWDFSPQSSEGRQDIGWSLLRDTSGCPLLWCYSPSDSTSASFKHQKRGVLEVWVASRIGKQRPIELSVLQGQRRFPLSLAAVRAVHEEHRHWVAYRSAEAVPTGNCALVITSDPKLVGSAEFGDVIVRNADGRPLRLMRDDLWRPLRALGIILVLAGLFDCTRLRHRPWVLLVLAVGLGVLIELYISTAAWGMNDDDWHLLPDQSSLLKGDLSGLRVIHLGHVLPCYRAVREICYVLAGTNGWLARGVSMAALVLTIVLLWKLLLRWSRSAIAATAAMALYCVNTNIYSEQLWWTSAENVTFCVLMVVATLACLDRYLRRGGAKWLAGAAVCALTAPLFYAGGVIAFPLAAIQWVMIYPASLRPWRRLIIAGSVFLLALVGFILIFRSGLATTQGNNEIYVSLNRQTIGLIADHCRQAMLWGLQTYARLQKDEYEVGGWILAGLFAAVALPTVDWRRRRLFLAGFLMAVFGYLVIFGIRTNEAIWKSHYQQLAFIGISMMVAASLAALCRFRVGRVLVLCLVPAAVIYCGWDILKTATKDDPIWAYFYNRQDHVVRAIAVPLKNEKPGSLSEYRVRHITASTAISLTQLASIITRTPFDELAERRKDKVDDIANPLVRTLYRRLAMESVDALLPAREPGEVLIASDDGSSATNGFFSLDDGDKTFAGSMGCLELPAGDGVALHRNNSLWYVKMAPQSVLRIYVARAGNLRVRAFLQRINPDDEAVLEVLNSERGKIAEWHPPTAPAAEFETSLPLHEGVNLVYLSVPAAAKQPYFFHLGCRVTE